MAENLLHRGLAVAILEKLPQLMPPLDAEMAAPVPDGRILGAQAVGAEGVDERIDVIATAMQLEGTVHDLAEAELCHAPQYGSAKDPVNLAGMIASNVLAGDMPLVP